MQYIEKPSENFSAFSRNLSEMTEQSVLGSMMDVIWGRINVYIFYQNTTLIKINI